METAKKNLKELQHLIELLDREHLELCHVHLKKAVSLVERNFNSTDYPAKRIPGLNETIRALDRDIKLKNQSDRLYYGKLIATSIRHLKEIHSALSEKYFHHQDDSMNQ